MFILLGFNVNSFIVAFITVASVVGILIFEFGIFLGIIYALVEICMPICNYFYELDKIFGKK